MGLISKYCCIAITNTNKKYYKELGYDVPNDSPHGSKSIFVNVCDVPVHSSCRVSLVCDGCGKELNWSMQDYTNRNHDGNTYCNKCAHHIFNSGENNPRWNPNLSEDNRLIKRSYPEYVTFTRKVLARDFYTCQCCGLLGDNDLEVHHLNGYDWFQDGRIDETNAVTLCHNCHNNFHSKYGKGHNTKEQYEEWIGYTVDYIDKFHGTLPDVRQVICLETKKIYKNIKEAANENNTQPSRIYKSCMMYDSVKYGTATKSVKGKHFLYVDIFNRMSDKEIKDYLQWCKTSSFHSVNKRHTNCKQIVCVELNLLFDSMSDASKYFHVSSGGICDCCKGRIKHCGTSKTGLPLTWMYYNNYIDQYDDIDLQHIDIA